MHPRTLLAVVVSTTALAGALLAGPVNVAGSADNSTNQASTKTVTYAGYSVEVPRSWPVYQLDQEPWRCVRFDRHAVYLGRPGPDPRCPSHLVGKVESMLIEPINVDDTLTGVDVVPMGQSTPDNVDRLVAASDHQIKMAVEEAGVLVTATYDSDLTQIHEILDSATVTSAAEPVEVPEPALTLDAPAAGADDSAGLAAAAAAAGGTKWAGKGFDACTAPSVGAMRAWMDNSPFGAANIYIGGISRACGQANLNASWVSTVHGQGWVLIPTYVGLQAPCTSFPNRINASQAGAQGRAAADDAVAKAAALGLGTGTPIYFDMEGYNNTIASCTNAVMTFLSTWTDRLHELGYRSGVYSSASSGMVDLVRNADRITDPDDIWFAHWDRRETLFGEENIPDHMWANRQRIHQYWGDHNETWGGVTINIDSNILDADVSGPGGGGPPPPDRVFVDTFADAPGFNAPGGSETGTLRAGTNYVFCRVWGPEVRQGDSVNHWWLLTDLDVGPARQWVSAAFLSRGGDDEAKDNDGRDIVDCNEPYGAIGNKWRAMGGVGSPVGPPKLPEMDSRAGGRFQEFQRGIIIWHPDTDAWAVYGAMLGHYWATGSEERWGFPVMDEAAAGSSPGGTSGRYQYMQHGLFMWSPDGGVHVIHGAIHDAFATGGREPSLGYPTSDEIVHPDGVGVYQTYQNATIHWTPQQGTWITR